MGTIGLLLWYVCYVRAKFTDESFVRSKHELI